MKQLVLLSGKGGTGKTSLAAAFAHLATCPDRFVPTVLADADVDAANLELVLEPSLTTAEEFWAGKLAQIDESLCSLCGECIQVCRFDAILQDNGAIQIDPIACEGCGACVYPCPNEAIQLKTQLAGYCYSSESRYGALVHAALKPAQENSGKLVTLVKQKARLKAMEEGDELVLVDGPPGTGCPVISAASGADLALIVTEPSVAGVHDMQRVLETCHHFGIETMVIVNKADLYPQGSQRIENYCKRHAITYSGVIPYDAAITESMVQGQPVTACCPDSPASQAIREIWQKVTDKLFEGE